MEKGRNLRSVNTDGGVNLQFKLLSAIGIIIIVSRHCYHGGMELAYNWFPPYSYNLALFVFIGIFLQNRLWRKYRKIHMETNKAASYSCVSVEYILRWYGCISRFVWIYYRCKAWFIQSFCYAVCWRWGFSI